MSKELRILVSVNRANCCRRRIAPTRPTPPRRHDTQAFVPLALPPSKPPLQLDAALTERLRRAGQALVRLDLVGEMVPSLDWFLHAFVRKEAVLSAQIAGTQATLVDRLTFQPQGPDEGSTTPNAEVRIP